MHTETRRVHKCFFFFYKYHKHLVMKEDITYSLKVILYLSSFYSMKEFDERRIKECVACS